MKTKNIKLKENTYNALVRVGRKNESFDDIVRKLLVFFKKKGGEKVRHKIIKAMIIDEPEDLRDKVAVDIATVDFEGVEIARNWAIYDTIDEAEADQLPDTAGQEVFERLKEISR